MTVNKLCYHHQVDSNMKLGEWAGLCKIDREGSARKVVKCSAAVVSDYCPQEVHPTDAVWVF